jgi:hypothetical protein
VTRRPSPVLEMNVPKDTVFEAVYIYDGASAYHRQDCSVLERMAQLNVRGVPLSQVPPNLVACEICRPVSRRGESREFN